MKRSLTQSFRSLATGSSQGSQRLDGLIRVTGQSRSGSGVASGPHSHQGSHLNSRASSKRNSLDISRDLRHSLAACAEPPADAL